jgi:hypothetical protein
MIYLKKGQPIFDNPGMVVYDPTGYYDDGTSVICAPVFAPEEPACRYEAKYIAYGGIVYSISDPDMLLKQITEMDPTTLFGKDSKQVTLDKAADKIVVQDPQDPNIVSEDPVVKDTPPEEPPQKETPTTTPPEDILSSDTSTTTNPVVDTTPIEVTPSEIPPSDTSTTTSPAVDTPVVEAPVVETPTITPPEEIIPIENPVSTDVPVTE